MDQPPPNTARVVQDGNLEVRNGQLVPVLVQASGQRMLVLHSAALSHMRPGQRLTLHMEQGASLPIVLGEIDQLALIARYTDATDAAA